MGRVVQRLCLSQRSNWLVYCPTFTMTGWGARSFKRESECIGSNCGNNILDLRIWAHRSRPLLLHIKRRQLWWLWHLTRMSPRLCFSLHAWEWLCFPRWARRVDQGDSGLLCSHCCHQNLNSNKCKNMDGWIFSKIVWSFFLVWFDELIIFMLSQEQMVFFTVSAAAGWDLNLFFPKGSFYSKCEKESSCTSVSAVCPDGVINCSVHWRLTCSWITLSHNTSCDWYKTFVLG